ncbi:peptidase S8/S53 domain-containing protein [Pseudomassariella vexata]|uniref:Peptidase S8/S53 domain-containing protein n=1 Tax=Pseudomassariella vexata TaxID=1141098 RepID=A0A1Y2EKS4_9PEZI|nr:peptidase S8/S53 domain-containing protein [Pseudomassariella vexata]ORY72160.1 peptidase S8/S53 domain-containing protein [Pseudomassariella vexata]
MKDIAARATGPRRSTRSGRREQPRGRAQKERELSPKSVDRKLKTFQDLESWLKIFILRNFSHSEALEMLYGPVAGGQSIGFNLLNANRRLTPGYIQRNYPFLKFENVLQHVALPNLLPVTNNSQQNGDHRARNGPVIKPTHYKEIFGWLRKKGKVDQVLVIIIEDDLVSPHDDETIVETLDTFKVDKWNWRKYDLYSETIFRAALNASTVYLYTSGNNSVLRGWSDESGLRKLRRVKVIYEKQRDNVRAPRGSKRQTWDQHKANSGLTLPRVKIALIDDGVDASHSDLSRIIKEGITYCTSMQNNRYVPSSFYASATGHGTLMAALICDMCPNAELYVAKLNDQNSNNGFSFTAKSAADAVRWAVSKNVDIISMSWTIEDTPKAKDDLASLNKALTDAANRNILMFCAARDEGLENPTNRPFPAASTTNSITIAGAAGPSGAISTWVSFESIHLLFPGLEIRDARQDLMPADMSAVDGSSTATACASGLAGLLLTILAGDGTKSWSEEGRHEKIKKIMASVAGNTKYVQVWDLFDEYTAAREGDNSVFQKLVDGLIYRSK